MKTSDVLNRAADLIEGNGWNRKGGWRYLDAPGLEHNNVCLEGALQIAADLRFASIACHPGLDEMRSLRECPAYRAVAAHVERQPLYDWNDAEGRTASEVVGVLRACAVIEAARESQDAAWETYAELVSA